MKSSTSLSFCLSVIAISIAGTALPDSMSPAQMRQVSQGAQRDVIVILRDQLPSVPPVRGALETRASSLAASQGLLIDELQQAKPRTVRSFSMFNGFATRVSLAEAARLAAHPDVQAVVPDAVIPQRRRMRSMLGESVDTSASASISASTHAKDKNSLCNTLEPESLELTQAAYLDASKPQAQQVRDGHGHRVTGKGVKVAFLSDGMDPNLTGFIRPDGSRVFIDNQDFSGDPAGTPAGGAEAFGDASSIAAQDEPNGEPLIWDISKFVNPAHPLPSPCNIRIRGMAPGASLVGLKVFSSLGYTTTSGIVQAIEYAVAHDVDVINESLGGNPYPDQNNDPISLANNAAVRAGVTVVVATGDAGTASTISSPATEDSVISVGATTSFRLYGQTGYGAQALAAGGISNNISSLSSAGFAQRIPRTVDVVAPGDLGWALCSANTALFTECTNFNSPPQPAPIQAFGGTSESAPLTAGLAALVIQAYRSTHDGADPSPALVKRIIKSTATDLGAPSTEQGAGLINALRAVEVALSLGGDKGSPEWHDAGVLLKPNSAVVVSSPNTHETRSFTITNTGTRNRHLVPSLETLGAPSAGATLDVRLDPSTDRTFINPNGAPRAYVKRRFTVPAGAEHLDAAIAWQVSLTSSATPIAYLALLDPSGRQAAYSNPQGLGSGYGHVDVVKPAAGTWTAIIWTRPSGVGSYSGVVEFSWAAERFVKLGSVHPASLYLAPGASGSVTADFLMPAEPGDLAAAIRFDGSGEFSEWESDGGSGWLPEIPVTLRTLIPLGPNGGDFTGTLTGGNGRARGGPTQTFEFDVPKGVNNMSLVLTLPDDGYLLEGLLVDPQGMELSVELNVDPFGEPQYALQLFRYNPQPGRWKFILVQDFTSSGNQTSLPFTARVGFNTAQVSAPRLPNHAGTRLSASAPPVTVDVQVINTGAVTQAFFADARLSTLTVNPLPIQPCTTTTQLPGTCGLFNVPTEVDSVVFEAQSTSPIEMDAYNYNGYNVGVTGSPDIFAKPVAPNTVAAVLSVPEVPYGVWILSPSLIGPYGPGGAPTTPVAIGALVLMQAFDSAVSADSGDQWADLTLGTSTFNPLILAPGATGIIKLTITPDSTQVGNTITGSVYIDTFDPFVKTGDEVVKLPYTYTVTP
jgi:Subtilase family/Peptidase inhibitor I9